MALSDKKRRLILENSDDSESDDYFISPRMKTNNGNVPIGMNEDRFELLKKNEDEKRIEKLDCGSSKIKVDCGAKTKHMRSESVKTKNRKVIDGEKDYKKVKVESSGDAKKPKMGVPQFSYNKQQVRADNFLGFKRNGNTSTLTNRKLSVFKLEGENKSNDSYRIPKSPAISKTEHFNGETRFVAGSSSSMKLPNSHSTMKKLNREKTRGAQSQIMISGSSIPIKKRVYLENNSPRDIKQKVKGRIRKMLFEAGWSIELRPRQNRDYKDAIYISPKGNSYSSITKAYEVFQSSEKSNYKSIEMHELDMLKRNVRNKRNQNVETLESSTKAKWGVRKRLHDEEKDEDSDEYISYEWKRTVLSWLIDLEILVENSKVQYINPRTNRVKLEGRIKREGILCNCCSKILTISKFELHAGSRKNQACENTYVQKLGVSLMQCLLDAWKRQGNKRFNEIVPCVEDPNDDTCGICADGGDLICCDGCPSTFHMACLGIEMFPVGDWHCMNCVCKFCSKNQEKDVCVSTLISCHQCGQKYHENCVPEKDLIRTSSSSTKNSYCSQICKQINKKLKRLLGVKNEIEGGYSWRLVRRLDESSPRYLKRLSLVANCNSKMAVAYNVMNECFLPIKDGRTGIDLIRSVVYNYGSNFCRLDFGGFYAFVLERGEEIISVASVRIHGEKLAEMPFIGTRNRYRRQGMCRHLLDAIESVLGSLNVKKLVIPAISELKSTWKNIFGFNQLNPSLRKQVRSVNFLMFPDTGLLQKEIPSGDKNDKKGNTDVLF